jgi:long-chain fatty acid transport protein
LLLALAGACATPGLASGFQLREQSPSAQGNSYAGISAGGDDIGGMFFNVATLTRFQGHEVVGGVSLVQPSARLRSVSGTRATSLGGSAITGSGAGVDGGVSAVLPMACVLWSLSPDLKLGLSMNSPFGLSSDYDSHWVGRYHAMKSTMTIFEFAPSLAYRIDPRWSVGGAVVGRHVQAELSNAVDFGAIGAAYHLPGSTPGGSDGIATVRGQRWGMGWKAGVLFEPARNLRFGAAYHSAIDFRLRGDVTYQGVPTALAGAFKNGGAIPCASQPATASLGAAWDATPELTLQAECARTFWSRFQDIRILFDTGQADSLTPEHWKDSWFLALGLTWRPGGGWTLRTGAALDQTPSTDTYRTPRIPDSRRTWVSAGAGYAFTRHFSMDAAYTHIFAKDATLDLQATPGSPDFFRGNLTGTYRNQVDILALQARYRFNP